MICTHVHTCPDLILHREQSFDFVHNALSAPGNYLAHSAQKKFPTQLVSLGHVLTQKKMTPSF